VINGFLAQVHRQHGVDVWLGMAVTEFHGVGCRSLVARVGTVGVASLHGPATAMLADQADVSGRVAAGVLVVLWAVLVGQVGVLRPRLDRRARRILTGQTASRSRLHRTYIALEAAKVVLLAVLGTDLSCGSRHDCRDATPGHHRPRGHRWPSHLWVPKTPSIGSELQVPCYPCGPPTGRVRHDDRSCCCDLPTSLSPAWSPSSGCCR